MEWLESFLLFVPQNQKSFNYFVSRLQYHEEWLRTRLSQVKEAACEKACIMLLLSFRLALGLTLRKFVITEIFLKELISLS